MQPVAPGAHFRDKLFDEESDQVVVEGSAPLFPEYPDDLGMGEADAIRPIKVSASYTCGPATMRAPREIVALRPSG